MPRKYFSHETERQRWQDPEAILAALGLKAGCVFVDVGCGEGFFAVPAAKIVGGKGKVYALDIDEEAIELLRERAAREGLRNLEATVAAAEDTVLCEACADMVFYGIVLHDFKAPGKVLANARVMLKPSGQLVDLDWKKEPMEIGPPLHIRFDEQQAADVVERAGFKIEQIRANGLYHYLLIAVPLTRHDRPNRVF